MASKLGDLYKRIKYAESFVKQRIADPVREWNSRMEIEHPDAHGIAEDLVTSVRVPSGLAISAIKNYTKPAISVGKSVGGAAYKAERVANDVASDAGYRLGKSLGDLFGKLNTKGYDYDNDDIVKELNQKEEIEVLRREAARLRRRARIEARKQRLVAALTDEAVRSPFI